eukprot:scaffold46367_cov11-Prasinocladus_malaysianus.AAC.1
MRLIDAAIIPPHRMTYACPYPGPLVNSEIWLLRLVRSRRVHASLRGLAMRCLQKCIMALAEARGPVVE